MDLLKRNWFWFVMGTLVVGCLAFYGLGVWPVRAENATLRAELAEGRPGNDTDPAIEPHTAKLEAWKTSWTSDPVRIPGDPQIQAYQSHAEALRKLLADSQGELKAPRRWQAAQAEDKWRVELLEDYSKHADVAAARYNDRVKDLFLPDEDKHSGYAHMSFLASGRDAFQFAQPPLSVSSPPDDILREGKRLMIQLELVRILNGSKVLRLSRGGIGFNTAGGAGNPEARKTASQPSLRAPLNEDPQRATYPFGLQVDIDLKDLPTLLDQLARSTFNLNVTGLQIDRLDANAGGDRRQELVDKGLVPGLRRNEIIHLSLACEAVEFLFGEARKGGKAP